MNRILHRLRKNYWHIISAIFASSFFVFVILPFLMGLKFFNTFVYAFLANASNIKLIIGTSSIIQLAFIVFGKRAWEFIKKYFNSIKKGFVGLGPIISIIIFIVLSVVLINFFETRYNTVLLAGAECILLFLLNAGLFLAIWLIHSKIDVLWKKRSNAHNEEPIEQLDEYVLRDDPIVAFSEDLLGRKKFVEDLYKEIVNYPFDNSFVFGLYGGWGEGKTSILNLLKKKFENNGNFLVVDFNPWSFKDRESILKAFYNQLECKFTEKFVLPGFSKAVKRYLQCISFGTQVGINISMPGETADDMRQRIESYIERTKMTLLVFIDDIDRLQHDEVLQIFSIVKCNARLKNTIFVLSFDPLVINNLLKSKLNSDNQYLEKIIQMPINLPAISSQNISAFLFECIDRLLDRIIGVTDYEKRKFRIAFFPFYRTYISRFFTTLRHVKRYINGLSATLPAIHYEINPSDFFILEVIRVHFPSVYNDIWNNRRFYIQVSLLEDPEQLFRKEEEINSAVKEHVQYVLKEAFGEDKKMSEVLLGLLRKLFPTVEDAFGGHVDPTYVKDNLRRGKRLAHPDCFDKYFTLKVAPLEISDEDLERILTEWNLKSSSEIDKSIEKTLFSLQREGKLDWLFDKLNYYMGVVDENLAIHIVKAIYCNAHRFRDKRGEFERDKVLVFVQQLIEERVSSAKIQNLLEEVISSTPSIPFALETVSLFAKVKDSFFNIPYSVDFKKLKSLVCNRLKKYFIDEKRDIFRELPEKEDWVFVLRAWASSFHTFDGKCRDMVSDYVLSLFKEEHKKFVRFLIFQGVKDRGVAPVYDLTYLDKIYNLEKFASFAEEIISNPNVPDEDKEIIKQFLEAYRKQYPA